MDDPKDVLKAVRRLVRSGSLTASTPGDWIQEVQSRISHLRSAEVLPQLDFRDTLQASTLIADFLDMTGRPREAAEELDRYVLPLAENAVWRSDAFPTSAWGNIQRVITARLKDLPEIRPDPPPDLLTSAARQIAWALMGLAWIKFYRPRRLEQAMRELDFAKSFIDEVIVSQLKHPAQGTLSRWHYYYGHCLRRLRGENLSVARDHFVLAQDHASARLSAKLEKLQDPLKRNEESLFAVNCTARLLNSYGLLSTRAGQQKQSLQFLLAARTLMKGTNHATRERQVRKLIAKVRRRAYRPASPDHLYAIEELRRCEAEFENAGIANEVLDCLVDRARGYVEVAEYAAGSSESKQANLDWCRDSLNNCERLIADTNTPLSDYWALAVPLIRCKVLVLEGRVKEAWETYESIRTVPVATPEYPVTKGYLYLHSGDHQSCVATLTTTLEEYSGSHLVEADCHILLARCFNASRDRMAADEHHRAVVRLLNVVDNAYIQVAEEEIREELRKLPRDFMISADEVSLNWAEFERSLKRWLLQTAKSRFENPTLEQLSKAIGLSPSTLSRWPGEPGSKKQVRSRKPRST